MGQMGNDIEATSTHGKGRVTDIVRDQRWHCFRIPLPSLRQGGITTYFAFHVVLALPML